MSYLIGIDGGGTRTTLAIAASPGDEVVRRTGPPGRVDPRDPESAVERLASLVEEAVAEAGLPPGEGILCAGLAGVRVRAEQDQVERSILRRGLAKRAIVRSDGEVALQGALGGRAGILLIAGTGSAAWGRAEDGRVASCGGWGLVMGDEGSGYAVGQEALRAVARAVDGRGPPTMLHDALIQAAEVADADSLRRWASSADKPSIAALARITVGTADGGDPVASRIVQEASTELAAHARALAERLGPWTGPVPVVIHGGLGRAPAYTRNLEAALQTASTPLHLRPPLAEPVTGALQIAGAAASPELTRSG
jgi:glucosamine kinase